MTGKRKYATDQSISHHLPNWQTQLKEAITSYEDLPSTAQKRLSKSEFTSLANQFPVSITPYYASLIDFASPTDPLLQMVFPSKEEFLDSSTSAQTKIDPICENSHAVLPGLIRRYPDRALILVTSQCAAYCRFCTRRAMGQGNIVPANQHNFDSALKYISSNPQIDDVIISGGDPLLLEDDALVQIVQKIRNIPSVKIIRIASRVPVTLPMRITGELASRIARYGPIFVNTHFNHPQELTEDATAAISHFVDNGIPVNNQSVLLRGINDNRDTLAQLFKGLLHNRVRPYYLFMCDLVKGTDHFRVSLDKAVELIGSLRGQISGLAIPTLVVDLPGGHGKIPITPNHIIERNANHFLLLAPNGKQIKYPL